MEIVSITRRCFFVCVCFVFLARAPNNTDNNNTQTGARHKHTQHHTTQHDTQHNATQRTGDVAVDLGRQEALGADARQAEHALERRLRRLALRQRQRRERALGARELERLVRHLAQHVLEVEVDGGRRAGRRRRVDERHAAAAVDRANHLFWGFFWRGVLC